jgi:hypothetical protein
MHATPRLAASPRASSPLRGELALVERAARRMVLGRRVR